VVLAFIKHRAVVQLAVAAPLSLGGLVVLGYLALTTASVTGLIRQRAWGFYALYALVVFGTVMLGVSFIPIRLGIMPAPARWVGLTLLNALVLVLAAACHRRLNRENQHAASGMAAGSHPLQTRA
jgi:hypothetical protein